MRAAADVAAVNMEAANVAAEIVGAGWVWLCGGGSSTLAGCVQCSTLVGESWFVLASSKCSLAVF